MAETKVCSMCGIEKSLPEFYPVAKGDKTRRRAACKHCIHLQGRKYSRKKEKERNELALKVNFNNLAKICSKCGDEKPYSEFYQNKSKKDGINTCCKQCELEEKKVYHQRNRDRKLKYFKDYWGKSKHRLKVKRKEHYEQNKDEILAKSKEYHKKNIEQIQKVQKVRYKKIRKDILIQKKEYYSSRVLYETYSQQLTIDESARSDGNGYLLVKCTYCGRFFYPKQGDVAKRVQTLKGNYTGESRLYCSDTCKKACPVFNAREWPKGYKKATSREVQAELRQMRLLIDDYTCKNDDCKKTIDEAELHCHHNTSVELNPIESADVDNCITLCKKCHIMWYIENVMGI